MPTRYYLLNDISLLGGIECQGTLKENIPTGSVVEYANTATGKDVERTIVVNVGTSTTASRKETFTEELISGQFTTGTYANIHLHFKNPTKTGHSGRFVMYLMRSGSNMNTAANGTTGTITFPGTAGADVIVDFNLMITGGTALEFLNHQLGFKISYIPESLEGNQCALDLELNSIRSYIDMPDPIAMSGAGLKATIRTAEGNLTEVQQALSSEGPWITVGLFDVHTDVKIHVSHLSQIYYYRSRSVTPFGTSEWSNIIQIDHVGSIPIASAADLDAIRFTAVHTFAAGTPFELTAEGGLDKSYIQIANIDLSSSGNREPIGAAIYGSPHTPFTGIYNGDGYTISGLTIRSGSSTSYGLGLFGFTIGATIKDLTIEGADIEYQDTISPQASGILIGSADNTNISKVAVAGTVKGYNNVGGLAGNTYGGTIITESFSQVTITGITDYSYWLGAFVGYLEVADVNKCFAEGTIVGGYDTGGFAGIYGGSASIANCYFKGSVSGIHSFGGFIGRDDSSTSSITNCYCSSVIIDKNSSNDRVGGFIGRTVASTSQKVTNCYYDSDVSGMSDAVSGEPRTTAEMTMPYDELTTYLNWNFMVIWNIDLIINNGYPFFRWETIVPIDPGDSIPIANRLDLEAIKSTDIHIFAEGTPYAITTSGGLDKNYIQVQNIIFGADPFLPIGIYGTPFTGTYDGNNFTIDNMQMHSYESYRGFFGYILNATIKNVNMTNCYHSNHYTNTHTQSELGILIGYSELSIIEKCTVSNSTLTFYNIGTNNATWAVGLLVGYAENTICTNCTVTEGYIHGGDGTGLLMGGVANSTVTDCYVQGEAHGRDGRLGGVFGGVYWGCIISRCGANVLVVTEATQSVITGGFVGVLWYPSVISECYVVGEVQYSNVIGGFVGDMNGTIQNCYARVNLITGTFEEYGMGGFVGYAWSDSVLEHCYSAGTLTGGVFWKGGFVGSASETSIFINCYYDFDLANIADIKSIARSTSQMTYPHEENTTYVDWDFNTIWLIKEGVNNGYPYFFEVGNYNIFTKINGVWLPIIAVWSKINGQWKAVDLEEWINNP